MKQVYMLVLTLLFFLMLLIPSFGGGGGQLVFAIFVGLAGWAMFRYIRWFKNLAFSVNELLPLLRTNPDQYIEETRKIMKTKHPKSVRTMLTLNIAVAYMEKGEYQEAKNTLLTIINHSLTKSNASVFFLNLTYVYIQLGESEEAMEYIQKYKKKFLNLPMGGSIPRLNMVINIFEHMEKGEWEDAKASMEEVQISWSEKVEGVDFSILQNRLDQHFNTSPTEIISSPDVAD